MEKDRVYVLDRLIEQCRQAYQAKTPLIMVDTEETELMWRLAENGNIVDFLEPVTVSEDSHNVHYYQYLGLEPDRLERCSNFHITTEPLLEMARKGGAMNYGKPAGLFLLQLTQSSWVTDNPNEISMISALRQYVRRYAVCRCNRSALRSSCVLLYGNPALLPKDLRPYTEFFSVRYPQIWEIKEIIFRIAAENDTPFDNLDQTEDLARLMSGFSLIQVEKLVDRLLSVDAPGGGKPLLFDPERREEIVLDAKAQAIESSGGLLRLYREKKKKDTIEADGDKLAGMGGLTEWSRQEAGKRMDQKEQNTYALERGVPSMKGVLLVGVPGCGKSEAAKILYRDWKVPMVRMDIDRLMGGLVGDSERNLREAIAQSEAMSPCILWMDELEKGFSAASSSQGDGGTFQRMFGFLLTWMQEKTKPVFIFATANDISELPPEFFRSGRFDTLFAVFMPTNDECKEIFREHMTRAERRRKEIAREQGRDLRSHTLFSEDQEMGCFTDSALQSMVDLIMEGKDAENPTGIKFVTGADIEKIVLSTLVRIPAHEFQKPIELATWKHYLSQVLRDSNTTTYGCSSAGLDKIAACYVRLLRENFTSVSCEDQQIFKKEYYRRDIVEGNNRKEAQVTYTGTCPSQKPYDQALFNALLPRIQTLGAQIETNALERICK